MLIDPDTHTCSRANEITISIVTDDYLALLPTKYVRPNLTSMHLSDVHSLLARASIGHDHGAAEPSIPGPVSNPTDASCIIEIILLDPVRVELTGEGEVWKRTSTRRWEWVLAFDAIEIAVKEAWVAIEAK